jgi:hypothetical protein
MRVRNTASASAAALFASLLVSPAAMASVFSYSLHLTGTANVSDSTDTSVSVDGATASLGYAPTLSLSSSSAGSGEAASATAFYQFTLNGPTAGITVPLDVTWSASVSAAVGAAASEYILIGSTYLTDESGISGTTYSGGGTYSTTATTGSAQGVLMLASAHGSINGAASAFVDPYLAIDPSFFASNPSYSTGQFSFTFNSPLIQNDQPAPEPSSLAVISAGLLATRMVRRRRDRRRR